MSYLFRKKFLTHTVRLAAFMASGSLLVVETSAQSAALEEVVVTSQFRDTALLDLAASASVFDEASISVRGAAHLEQLLNMAPNVNFSSGASRGRFFQIRGIGERSQFIDPVNPSVGLIVDGIDFTGLGLAASTLDIEQIEILRGPQGTVYGANALAGLITMTSHAPSATPLLKLSAEIAEYNSNKFGVVASGPVNDQLAYRFAAQSQQSDGYVENDFLGRDDTNNIDETVLRGKLRYQADENLQLDFSLLYLDVDNGYDAFSLDNSRHTLSDQPGKDTQETVAASLIASWDASQYFALEATLSLADSESEYSFDEDWVFVGFHPGEYMSADDYDREKDNVSLDVRFISTDDSALFEGRSNWVAGLYLRSEEESMIRRSSFSNNFETENVALYGQLKTALHDGLNLLAGLRFEQRDADYRDNLGVSSQDKVDLWGGDITLEYQYTDNTLLYGTVSRGYKAGGVNGQIISAAASNPTIGPEVYEFDTESLLNYELGLKGNWLDGRLQAQLAAFYQDRKDVQAKQSIFDPSTFAFDDYLANAAGGKTTGLEAELNYLASERVRLFASVGWLNAEFEDFVSASHVDARDDVNGIVFDPVNLDGREVAHAPKYQFFVGAELSLTARLTLRLEAEGKDQFYFSNSHNEQSTAYELFNARLTYRANHWDLSLWARNLTDKEYYTRGFYFSNQFGNNPANAYAPEPYYQLGEPRVVGVSASYTF